MSTTHLGPTTPALMTARRHQAAWRFDEFLGATTQNTELWTSTAHRATLDDAARARAARIVRPLHVHALLADWCTDAIGTIPWIVRIVEAMPQADFRCVDRDAHLDLMDTHLTSTARAIPVVMVFDAELRELGWWGPRPVALHEWALHEAPLVEKAERNKYKRTWYAHDRGVSTVAEVLALLEATAGASS